MGVLHLVIFVIGCAVLGAIAIRQRGSFLRRAGHFGLFMGVLLAVGSIFNGVWSCLIWGRLYFSTDYVFDFSPFWPITRKVVDASFGDMRGELLSASLFQLQLVWLFFAAGTWAVTILVYRRVCKRPPASQLLQATPGSPGN